jgi:hypothetical protein
MKKIDFIIQTLLLFFALMFLVFALIIDNGFFIMILITQFFVGCWQLISAFLTSLDRRHGNPERTKAIRIFWIGVLIYFVVLGILFNGLQEMIWVVWFFTAWLIAIYYYVFTIKLTFGKFAERRTFLDIAN